MLDVSAFASFHLHNLQPSMKNTLQASFNFTMKLTYLLPLMLLLACNPAPSAQEIVDKGIEAAGVQQLKNSSATFVFREIDYTYKMSNGGFEYTRSQQDSLGNTIKDVLTNDGLQRFLENEQVEITEKKQAAFSASINSVIYFAFLPMSLNDAAVIKEYKGLSNIKDIDYHKVKVTFKAEGGGEDHEDEFYYWFDAKDYGLDYLAYNYREDDGQGVRFREAFNQRIINGVTIQDYRNFKPAEKTNFELETMDQAFEKNQLTLLSVIELELVYVE
jgi:hypothetical protein